MGFQSATTRTASHDGVGSGVILGFTAENLDAEGSFLQRTGLLEKAAISNHSVSRSTTTTAPVIGIWQQ